MARALAQAGANIVIVSRNGAELDAALPEILEGTTGTGVCVVADLTDRSSADRVVREAGRVDILISNAGFNEVQPVDEIMFHSNRGANPEELLVLKRSVFALRMSLYPLREAFSEFPKREHALFDLETPFPSSSTRCSTWKRRFQAHARVLPGPPGGGRPGL